MDAGKTKEEYVALVKKLYEAKALNQTDQADILIKKVNELGSLFPYHVRRNAKRNAKEHLKKRMKSCKIKSDKKNIDKVQEVKDQIKNDNLRLNINEKKTCEGYLRADVQRRTDEFLKYFELNPGNHSVVMNKKDNEKTMHEYVELMDKISEAEATNQTDLVEVLKKQAIAIRSLFPYKVRQKLSKSMKQHLKKNKQNSYGNMPQIKEEDHLLENMKKNALDVTSAVDAELGSYSKEHGSQMLKSQDGKDDAGKRKGMGFCDSELLKHKHLKIETNSSSSSRLPI